MPSLRTDPALAARRRPLKPLLAEVLTGEPWIVVLQAPQGLDPAVQAACIVSYLSRRHDAWETIPLSDLFEVLESMILADRAVHPPGRWPFLDALEVLLPAVNWTGIDSLLETYRCAVSTYGMRGGPPRAVGAA